MSAARTQPWYREPWPWILMAGPAIVVVAGCITAWLAFHGEDGLVADDYYKQGLAINQSLGRSEAAERLGVQAQLQLADGRVRVMLGSAIVGGRLSLRLAHPTRAGMDQSVNLAAVEPGVYEGLLRPSQPGRWHVVLEARDWRLAGDWIFPAAGALTLGNLTPAPAQTGASMGGRQ
jgi:uncharacterized protein